eukprot:3063679-Pleurochrysis_carterae.AAC.1
MEAPTRVPRQVRRHSNARADVPSLCDPHAAHLRIGRMRPDCGSVGRVSSRPACTLSSTPLGVHPLLRSAR